MPRYGGRSKGCLTCRQRRVKVSDCDQPDHSLVFQTHLLHPTSKSTQRERSPKLTGSCSVTKVNRNVFAAFEPAEAAQAPLKETFS